MGRVGILAFGSLIEDPGAEIEKVLERRIEDVQTPFHVEYARASNNRGGAPTLVPVNTGGAPVDAVILVLGDDVGVGDATNMLWRRETRKEGSYPVRDSYDLNEVEIKSLNNFHNIDTVLYTSIGATIAEPSAEGLACRAIESVKKAKPGQDGISYLESAMRQGIKTPLTDDYKASVLAKTSAASLAEALESAKGLLSSSATATSAPTEDD